MLTAQIDQQGGLVAGNVRHRDIIQIAVGASEDRGRLFFKRHRRELSLLQQLRQARTAVEQLLGRSVEVRAELGESRHFAVLRQLQLDRAGDLLHRLGLRRGADARHREADVDGRTDALVERSEEHTSELQSLMRISYAVFCLKKKKN